MSEQNKIDEIKERLAAAPLLKAKFGTDGSVSVAHDYERDVTYLLQHVAELKSEIDLVKEELFYEKRASEESHAKYVEQYQRAERKDEALRFYADDFNWTGGYNHQMPALSDRGRRAWEAL